MRQLFGKWRKVDICYMLIGIAILYCFLLLLYSDNLINAQQGYDWIDSIFSGTFKEYYNSTPWSYGISIYFIYAVWSVPVWIVFHAFGIPVDMLSIPVLLWYKLLLALFAGWSVWLVGKIAQEVYGEFKREVQLQYVCSAFFVFPIFYIAQCDIIGLCFVLVGIYYYMKEDNKKFLISFAIAITMKYFALFAFIPLILFRYRKLGKMFRMLWGGAILIAISMLVISGSDTGAGVMGESTYYVNQHIQRFSEISVELNPSVSIGLLGFFYMVLCVLAYIIPNDDKEKNKRYTLWLAFAGYLSFFLFYMCNFYWYVLLAPFIILIAFNKPQYLKVSLLLEVVYGVSTAICHAFLRAWVFMGPTAYNYLFLRKYGENVTENGILFLLRKIAERVLYEGWDWTTFIPVLNGIAYAGIILLLVLQFPGTGPKAAVAERKEELLAELKIVTLIRISVIYFWIFVSLLCLIGENRCCALENVGVIW